VRIQLKQFNYRYMLGLLNQTA